MSLAKWIPEETVHGFLIYLFITCMFVYSFIYFYVLFYSPDDHEEDEKNLVYVAVTRAKKCLQLNSTILSILGSRKVSLFLSYAFKLVSPWHFKLAKNKTSEFRDYVNDNCKSVVLVRPVWKAFCCVPDRVWIWFFGFWGEGKTGSNRRKKILRARERTNDKRNPQMTLLLASGIG